MKLKTTKTIFGFLAFAFTASAAELNLTHLQIQQAVAGLRALDGYAALDANKNSVAMHYEFNGKIRRAIAHDLMVLTDANQKLEAELNSTLASIRKDCGITEADDKAVAAHMTAPDKNPPLAPDRQAAMDKASARWNDAQIAPTKVEDITQISEDDLLDGDVNPVPGSILQFLAPLNPPDPAPTAVKKP